VRRPGIWAGCVGLCFLFGSTCAEAASASETLYEQYEKLNTPENLGKSFAGGKLYPFQEQQIRILGDLEKRPTIESARVIAQVVDEYLKRIEALGAQKFRQSPLQALQLAMVSLCEKHAGSNIVFAWLEALARSPLTKEYARGRALGAVAARRLREVKPEDDADGKKRGQLLLDLFLGDLSMSRLFHAPARLRQFAEHADTVLPGDPVAFRNATVFVATTPPKRYAADFAFASAIAEKQIKRKQPLSRDEKRDLLAVCNEWLKTYRPLAAKENYATDLLGSQMLVLGGYAGNEDLAALLVENGLKPIPYVEKPDRPVRPRPPRR